MTIKYRPFAFALFVWLNCTGNLILNEKKEGRKDEKTPTRADASIAILGGIVLWADHKTAALARTTVHRLDNIDHLLPVIDGPLDFLCFFKKKKKTQG